MSIRDYRKHTLTVGHDITIEPANGGMEISGCLWSQDGLTVGDYLLLGPLDNDTRYQVIEARRFRDPADMHSYRAAFAPRQATS